MRSHGPHGAKYGPATHLSQLCEELLLKAMVDGTFAEHDQYTSMMASGILKLPKHLYNFIAMFRNLILSKIRWTCHALVYGES